MNIRVQDKEWNDTGSLTKVSDIKSYQHSFPRTLNTGSLRV